VVSFKHIAQRTTLLLKKLETGAFSVINNKLSLRFKEFSLCLYESNFFENMISHQGIFQTEKNNYDFSF